jgi:F-type H+-transporting ATPase subunit alpha
VAIGSDRIGTSIKQRIKDYHPAVNVETSRVAIPDTLRDMADGLATTLERRLVHFRPGVIVEEVGTVTLVGDGIARVRGLRDAMAGELLQFPGQLLGMALNLDEDSIGCVLLGSYDHVCEGDQVRRTGRIAQVPVGEALIGRVVDPLGRPLDGEGPIVPAAYQPVEGPAPGIMDRQNVYEPLQTGLKAIDALTPIGRGQRELIIGDRQTGKTAIAIDTIINQAGQDMICIYVAIGQKASTVAGIIEKLRESGAMDYTIVVLASAADPAPLLFLAPYAGTAMGEYFMYAGRHVLCVYDDLSKHATAYRELSLLLRRPPGREGFPGDVFYLHSRLLERAAKLSDALGGGSLTALPIVETQAGDVSAYIPTNVISITDGQIFLETDLFYSGQRPAINVGISVSRVGGDAQISPMRRVSSSLRLDLSQYRELAAFAQFGAEIDDSTRQRLTRGERIQEVLKQDQYEPMSAADQVVVLFAAVRGYLDRLETERIRDFEQGLIGFMNSNYSDVMERIARGEWDEAMQREVREAIVRFSEGFAE